MEEEKKTKKKTTSKTTGTKKIAPKKKTETTKKAPAKKATTKKTPTKKVEVKEELKKDEVEEVKVETPSVVEEPKVVEEVKTESTEKPKKKSMAWLIILIVVIVLVIILLPIFIFVIPALTSADIIVNKDSKIEVGTNVYLKDVVLMKKNIMLIEPLKYVDTKTLGEKELEVRYVKNRRENRIVLKINVVDTTAPTIECDNKIEVYTTDDINEKIKDKVKIKDNDKNDLEFKVENLPKEDAEPGEYSIKIKTEDASGNKAEKDVALVIKTATIKSLGFYIFKSTDVWDEYFFKEGKAYRAPWYCPNKLGLGCGGVQYAGTYEIKGNKLSVTLTNYADETSEKKLNPPEVVEFTINSEDEIVLKNNKYTWYKSEYADWAKYFE